MRAEDVFGQEILHEIREVDMNSDERIVRERDGGKKKSKHTLIASQMYLKSANRREKKNPNRRENLMNAQNTSVIPFGFVI